MMTVADTVEAPGAARRSGAAPRALGRELGSERLLVEGGGNVADLVAPREPSWPQDRAVEVRGLNDGGRVGMDLSST
jgi:hypothetical protein